MALFTPAKVFKKRQMVFEAGEQTLIFGKEGLATESFANWRRSLSPPKIVLIGKKRKALKNKWTEIF